MAKKKSGDYSMNATAAYKEQDWRAQEDCRTLMEAEKIERDPARFKAAKKEAKRKVKELQAMMDAAKDLAGGDKDEKGEKKIPDEV